MLGERAAVDRWLADHASELAELAEQRRLAAEKYRDDVIRRNMKELVDLLVSDADMLPGEAAERISVRRIASKESGRTAADLMGPLPTIPVRCSIRDAAAKLVEANSPILAVVNSDGDLAGVVTDWDITRASAQGTPGDRSVEAIMTRQVISALPTDGILEMVRKLEHYEISAMPVVEQGCVQGMVSADLLARRSLLRLLQSQVE